MSSGQASEPEAGQRRALVIAAHPDDGDFGAAGWCSMMSAKGWEIAFLVCTNGAKGTEPITTLSAVMQDAILTAIMTNTARAFIV